MSLAEAILDFEAEYPGEPDLWVQMPGEAWARLVELAKAELEKKKPRKKKAAA